MANIERYPLTWPTIYPRTPAQKLQKARFEVSFAKARDELLHELELLGGKTIIISSNIPLRKDGLPYANTKDVGKTRLNQSALMKLVQTLHLG